ncbi:MAG: peptidylprolyl isomerase [Muribaculaceae bacterium]|nr:peptidylprolyl isomerase [Muribaculaceae bacterium]
MEPVYDKTDAVVELKTTMGDIIVELFNDTPLHRDNFLKLVKEGFYDGVLFHRVIDSFMIQTGDPNSKNAKAGEMLGDGDLGYTVEAEIEYPKHYNKRGALAAARTGDNVNPERRSSASQFYIVTGRDVSEAQLQAMEMKQNDEALQKRFRQLVSENKDSIEQMRAKGDEAGLEELRRKLIKETEESVEIKPLPQNLKDDYLANGGAPHLDGAYTVFGQVLKGMDVVDKIQKVETDSNDRPVEDVKLISARIIKNN